MEILVFMILLLFAVPGFAWKSPTLPKEELDALQIVGQKLMKKNWNMKVNPCDMSNTDGGWRNFTAAEGSEDFVTCICSFVNGTVCHVTSILLKTQDLQGSLPKELVGLPFLQEINLARNYLTGSIPSEWGVLRLVNITLLGNRLTGSIPKEIGNIITLERLVLENNMLSGLLPPELGRLSNLRRLMISDMTGPESLFPPLECMTQLRQLVLRNVNLSGELPPYLGTNATNLTLLDLSFNKLRGAIPRSYEELRDVENFYLSGNMLNGSIPSWMPKEKDRDIIDLTYNKFSEDVTTKNCVDQHMNLFAGSYKIANNSLSVFCLKSFQCPRVSTGLHINCGGDEVTMNGTTYEADKYDKEPMFFENGLKGWVMSNTGHFLDDHIVREGLTIWSNSSRLSEATDPRLYAHARLSAISLTYFAMCLQSGDYKVKLHFAEIIFSSTKSYKSLGRRLFDIYIQERLVLKDFNIAEEAGGVGKAIVKTFPVTINDGKLQIRLYWAGKGTVSIPEKSVYGPLISAISVDPDFDSVSRKGSGRTTISLAAAIGIAVAVTVFVILLICGGLWLGGCIKAKSQIARDFKKMDFKINTFSLRQIKEATDNFAPANKIGEGGFGPVYKGMMSNGTAIAVKQLSDKSKQGNREFLNEIGIISALQHPSLIKLHGCCVEGRQLLLVYEYLENNSLDHALFGPLETQISLDWPTRHKICVGVAKGLAYLHEESRLKILHRDIKAANILLDQDLNPRISDFGLAKLDPEDQSHISTKPTGTFGYMAPEYAQKGHLSDKTDVYSFGVVLMEVVHGKINTTPRPDSQEIFFVDWVRHLWKLNELEQFVDPRLQSYDVDEVSRAIKVAILCTSRVAADRPPMSEVVSMLEGQIPVEVEKRSQMAVIGGDEEQAFFRELAEIDALFESQEITESQETQPFFLRKGKEKLSCAPFDIEAESSRAGEERE